ncbi:MAG: type I DNA topoisomerase [Acidimicrobiia bacterium]|nr:type I DNA topoisomerase [Acidimicrobiia bacterium]
MPKPLVIVESPAKAKTIAGYLGDEYNVDSSVGHIRDLAVKSELSDEVKAEPWAEFGVNIYDGFKAVYLLNPDKKSKVRELRAKLKEADELYLATDEDREGEAIAWHLLEELRPPRDMPVKRMVFHEITPQAIAAALESPREINTALVDAQETRRILDRLFGWDVTKVVRRVTGGASAGRVQSVAVRIVVERERERMAFVAADYWSVAAELARVDGDTRAFRANVVSLDGRKLAVGGDFAQDATVRDGVEVLDEPTAARLADELRTATVTVSSVERRPHRQRPSAPFTTSTLQQEAGRKLRFSAQRTMRAAQGLYERGFITYMRTDSTTLSEVAIGAARREISERYGAANLPDAPRTYKGKAKNAQEAHEAIRPAGDRFTHPDQVAASAEVNRDMAAVYRLIWQRTVASQMTDATGETVTVRMAAPLQSWPTAELRTSGTVITHQGFRLVYVEDTDDEENDDDERQLPQLTEGDGLDVREVMPDGHTTKPPARYTEASLVKRLEELGVGRPSTYASTIGTILDRGYVWKKGTALVPSWRAFAVTTFMEEHFAELVDYQFTARLEDRLDEITTGERDMLTELTGFYWGEGGPVPPGIRATGGLRGLVDEFDETDIRPVIQTVNPVYIGDDPKGVPINVWPGKKGGPYLKRGDDTASVPEDLPPDELTVERALELLSMPREGRLLGTHPDTGLPIYAKAGRFGPYVQHGDFPEDPKKGPKPQTASLFSTMTVERVTLEDALELLTLPRVVGVDPDDGGEVTAANGRFGPYVQKVLPDESKDSRSLENEEQLLTVTLDQAKALFAQPKRRRGQAAPKPPLATFGDDPESGKPIVLKEGRFGPYVTDGDTNASLRTGDDPETIGRERALELLAERRAKVASGEVGGRKKATKKKATKKSPAKKATKKAAKKSPAKKATKKAAKKAPPSSDDAAS